jgi:hypothetical protein
VRLSPRRAAFAFRWFLGGGRRESCFDLLVDALELSIDDELSEDKS